MGCTRDEREADRIATFLDSTPQGAADVQSALERAWQVRCLSCPRSADQVRRRLWRAARLRWPVWASQLRPPERSVGVTNQLEPTGATTTTAFRTEEVRAMREAAQAMTTKSGDGRPALLLELLLTTGLRIAAAARLQWLDVLVSPDGGTIGHVAVVREKGGCRRALWLSPTLRTMLQTEHRRRRRRSHSRAKTVFGVGVRQLRNIFYRVCRQAGVTGCHCHPHTARHTVAHELFRAGNPVALIAKFLGHRSLETTNRYYLHLQYEEVLQRMRIPWMNTI